MQWTNSKKKMNQHTEELEVESEEKAPERR
jgi:hypothetical protein